MSETSDISENRWLCWERKCKLTVKLIIMRTKGEDQPEQSESVRLPHLHNSISFSNTLSVSVCHLIVYSNSTLSLYLVLFTSLLLGPEPERVIYTLFPE